MAGVSRNDPVPSTDALARLRRLTWWSLPPAATFVAAVGLVVLLFQSRPWWAQLPVLACYAAAGAGVVYLLHRSVSESPPGAGRGVRAAWVASGAGSVGGVVLASLTGPVFVEWPLLAGVVGGTGAIWLRRYRWWPLLAAGAAVALAGVVSGAPLLLPFALVTLVGGWGFWLTWWYYDIGRQLDHARLQAAELAVANERLRFAGELHDIQGHHLQVIALKSELAARLTVADPTGAVTQMQQVQQLAREALTETRSLVGGYRTVTLGTEIANATRVLAAAEVDARPRIAASLETVNGAAQRLLALVVREATTNILRHAQPRRACLELAQTGSAVRLKVSNDGAGGHPAPPTGAAGGEHSGTGLAGLAERLAAAGGELSWGHDGDRFTVRASMPLVTATPPAPEAAGGRQ